MGVNRSKIQKMPKKNSKKKQAPKPKEPEPIVRYYKGQKKNYDSNTAKAPWDGSSFESQARSEQNQSEYHKTFYSKPGVFKADPIRPGCDNRHWMIGNVAEQMNCSTTYTGVFLPKSKQERTRPYRPQENGIHYELSEKTSMTTTHDRTYQLDEFPPNRTVDRAEDENNGESTMKTDYSYKRIDSPAMPFRPPVGLSDTLGSSDIDPKANMRSTNNWDFVTTDIKTLEPVKNCKPIRIFEKPTEPMEITTTTHSEFKGTTAPPAKSCKPAPRSNGI